MSAHTPLPGPARTPAPKVDGLSAAALGSLQEQLRGAVVRPGDSDYDRVRRVWNTRVDRHPALIVRPSDAADVTATVDFARANDLPLAVRGGGQCHRLRPS